VQQVPEDSLVVAELKDTVREEKHFKRVSFGCLPRTWRDPSTWKHKAANSEQFNIVSKGKLLAYLNPVPQRSINQHDKPNPKRVIDREDSQLLIPGILEQLSMK
jgi:hypothetical protein